MGHKPKRTIYKLVFDDSDMHDLEVKARKPKLGTLAKIKALGGGVEGRDEEGIAAALDEMLAIFAKHLQEWNVTDDDDSPLPATLESLQDQDDVWCMEVIGAWVSAAKRVNAPLSTTSSGGATSVEASMPMEPLSASQAS